MERSTERILTTHTGSLPRPPELLPLLEARAVGEGIDDKKFKTLVREAVSETVERQVEAGVTVLNDGEMSKISYAGYLKDRLNGFAVLEDAAVNFTSVLNAEGKDFPEFFTNQWARMRGSRGFNRACCVGPIAWKDFSLVQMDLDNLKEATKGVKAADVFMTAPSPGIAARFQPNRYFKTEEEYLYAIANAMSREYQAIVDAGFVLQVDCPDFTVGYRTLGHETTMKDFRKIVARNVEVLNDALKEVPPEQSRIHVCWGADEAPHHWDPPLKDIIDLLLKAKPLGITIVGANGRHEYEWKAWEDASRKGGHSRRH